MAIKIKLVLSTLVNQGNQYTTTSFLELDTYLSSNKDNLVSDVIIRTTAISLIKNTYSLLGISDPILSITGRYYKDDGIGNLVTNLGENNPFIFYNVTVNTTNNSITLQLILSFFKTFYNESLPQISLDIDSNFRLEDIIIDLFIDAMIDYLSTVGQLNYSVYSTNTLSDRTTSYNTSNYFIESNYNFYSKTYEEYFSGSESYLPVMPNYYSLYDAVENTDLSYGTSYLVLNGNVPLYARNPFKDLANYQYYDNFGSVMQASSSTSYINYFKTNNSIFLIDTIIDQTTIGNEDFPYSNKITFSNNIERSGLDDLLINKSLQTLGLSNFIFYNSTSSGIQYTKEETNELVSYNDTGTYRDSSGRKYNLVTSKVISFSNQITSIDYNNIYSVNSSGGFIYNRTNINLAPFQEIYNTRINHNSDRTSLFTYVELLNELNNLYTDYINYNTVYNLEELQRITTLGYVIEKKNSNGVILQSIYIPKNNNKADIEYIDTQIPYNTDITYDVYSLDTIPTLSYQFRDIVKTGSRILTINVPITLTPKLTKNLLFNKVVRLTDNPPVPPIVNFITYQSVSDLLTLNLTTQVSELLDTPINILQSDQQILNNTYNYKNRTDGKMLFKTNDPLKNIQIFIIANTKPTSYIDFQNVQPIDVPMNNAFSKSINVQIRPNTKYYILCRSVDTHGLISNPTPIYEVEIVSDGGAIYPLINSVNFDTNKNYDVKKSFKKYLHIKPATQYTQLITNEMNEPQLGIQDQKLWGQKYKVRISSKKSGKSFDINLTYNKNEQDLT